MANDARTRLIAAALAVLAAFLWATYYLFVLWVTPGTRPSAVLFYPFVGGAAAYVLWVVARGEARPLGREFRDPEGYLRAALLVGMQLAVLAATYLAGPVDASLLALLGDVVATPLVVAALFALHRAELRSPAFALGLALSVAGGSLAIVGGHGVAGVHGSGWLAVAAVPPCVAFYFILSARAGRTRPVSVVVTQATLTAGAFTLVLAPLVPGGWAGILDVRAVPALLLLANGVASFCLGPLAYFAAIDRAGLVLPPMLMTGIPVFTLLLSATVLAIAPAPLALLGVPVAVLGGLVVGFVGGAGASGSRPVPADPPTPNR